MEPESRGASPAAGPGPAPPTTAFLATLVALALVMNTYGRGVAETFAVFLLPVERELGVSRSAISATYSIYMLVVGLSGPFAGQFIDRFGARWTYGAGLLVMGVGYILAGSATKLWHYYACVGVLGGIGTCTLGMVIASSLLTRWFTHRIGSVVALPYAAMGIGMLIFPPLTQLLLDHMGWRSAHRVLGSLVLLSLPIVMLLPLETMSSGSGEWQAARSSPADAAGTTWTLRTAMRTGAFWSIVLIFLLTSIAAYAVMPQSVAFLIEQGFDPFVAASAFGMIGVMSMLGILGIGVLSDRIGRVKAATLSYVSSLLGLALLIAVAYRPSLLLVYGFVVFFGTMQGARGPLIVAMIAKVYKGGNIGAIYGASTLGQGLGGAIGSWVSGLLHDWTGGYVPSILFAITCALTSLSIFWLVPSIRHENVTGRPPAPDAAPTAGA